VSAAANNLGASGWPLIREWGLVEVRVKLARTSHGTSKMGEETKKKKYERK